MDNEQLEERLLEGHFLEFKGGFYWNSRIGRADGDLRLGTAKSVAAFSNSNGGRLIIGAADDGSVTGINAELTALFGRNHLDQFENLIHEHLKCTLHPYTFSGYSVAFEQRGGLWICCLSVPPIQGITYVRQKTSGGRLDHLVFVRTGARTILLKDVDRDRFVVERLGGMWSMQ